MDAEEAIKSGQTREQNNIYDRVLYYVCLGLHEKGVRIPNVATFPDFQKKKIGGHPGSLVGRASKGPLV